MTVFERWWIWHARVACQLALARRGGTALVDDACIEASWYVDMLHPWDGRGGEPDARVHAWLSILVARRLLAEGMGTGQGGLER